MTDSSTTISAHDLAPPRSILIVGAGIFGLSTCLSLLSRSRYNSTHITLIDSSSTLPNPVGSSVDSSRIVRADYSSLSYAKLACEAQLLWRDPETWGRFYHESGFVLTGEAGEGSYEYTKKSLENVRRLAREGVEGLMAEKLQELRSREEVLRATGLPGSEGDVGYANWNSGWADADWAVGYALDKVRESARVGLRTGCEVKRLRCADHGDEKPNGSNANGVGSSSPRYIGVELMTGEIIDADLTILATGAWTPSLLPSQLRDRALATGQVLGYVPITEEELAYLRDKPVVINFAKGTFIIPPRDLELKVARHGYGYLNPVAAVTTVHDTPSDVLLFNHSTSIHTRLNGTHHPTNTINGSSHTPSSREDLNTNENTKKISYSKPEVSYPSMPHAIPLEAQQALRTTLADLFPQDMAPSFPGPTSLSTLSTRPFNHSRVCWYTDTPDGNFIIDWAPSPSLSLSQQSQSTTTHKSYHSSLNNKGEGLFLCTGGSGHAFKFLPIIGKYVVDAIEGKLEDEYRELWRWRSDEEIRDNIDGEFTGCDDGSRGGRRGMILSEEMKRCD